MTKRLDVIQDVTPIQLSSFAQDHVIAMFPQFCANVHFRQCLIATEDEASGNPSS
jgi:hypothetical protein